MHIEYLANGLGAQSMWLLMMAARREIPATVSLTAETGWERDRLWNTGRRSTNAEYFAEVVVPIGLRYGLDCRLVHTSLKDKTTALVSLIDRVRVCAERGVAPPIPMYGSKGGQLMQSCTEKWKIRAMRQALRKMGAKTSRGAQGIHFAEADRRVKGVWLGLEGTWNIYQTTEPRTRELPDGTRQKYEHPVKWQTHYYPLVDLKYRRESIQRLIVAEKIPYLISSECDGCPHQDLPRWNRTSPATLLELAEIEKLWQGKYFFTDRRIPLMDAIAAMESDRAANPERYKREADFGCRNDVCGV